MTRDTDIPDHELEAASWRQASMGRNDPLADAETETVARIVRGVASRVVGVHVVEGRDPHIEVRTNQPRNRSELTLTAQAMGHLFEAPVIRRAAPDAIDAGDVSYRQLPRHSFYKDDRRDD